MWCLDADLLPGTQSRRPQMYIAREPLETVGPLAPHWSFPVEPPVSVIGRRRGGKPVRRLEDGSLGCNHPASPCC